MAHKTSSDLLFFDIFIIYMFKFKVNDDFLDNDDFDYINSIQLANISNNELKVYKNQINKSDEISSSCFSEEFIRTLAKKYNPKALKILDELCPSKTPLWEYTDFNLIMTGANCSFPIHRDTPNKLLSGVIYLYPEKNTGTILYKNIRGDDPKVIEWKPNRAFFFSRNEKDTFHSYKGDGVSTRVALVYNLCTSNLKRVCEIDQVNYHKVRIREFLSPIIYKYFKKVL